MRVIYHTEYDIEIIFHSEEERERATMDYIFPEYVPKKARRKIIHNEMTAFVLFIPPRSRKWARENKHYPAYFGM